MGASGIIWLQCDDTPISCVEKLKLLDENIFDFKLFFQDILDDALAIGCTAEQVKEVFIDVIQKAESGL